MDLSRFEGPKGVTFADKKVALLGFGIENISVAKFLLKHKIDFQILDKAPLDKLTDEGQKEIKDKGLKIKTGEDYLSDLEKFDIIIRSPGIPYLTPEIQAAKSSGSEITSSTKLFFDWCPAKIIGVTGTKGKGTTASLIAKILEAGKKSKIFLLGNIGIPSFDVIEKVAKDDIVVFELSSFQLQDMEKSPHIAIVVNLADDHLDYHQTIEEYRATKQNILRYQSEKDFAIINWDYPESRKLSELGKAKKYYFSSQEKIVDGAYVDSVGDVFLTLGKEEKICSQGELKLIGRHNLENIASAVIVSKILCVPTGIIGDVVKKFDGLPHRLEFVREVGGVKFYNDSFSTNPTPTMAAIDSFPQPITIILGGSSKGADFSQLAKKIKSAAVKNVILIGDESQRIKKALEEESVKTKIIDGGKEIKEIVKKANEATAGNGVVLFSPACASFDMFKNYKDRGERFKDAVARLK